MSVYSDYFFDPFDDESPQNKATREDLEDSEEEAELEEAEEAMWSSFSVGGELYEELAVGDIHVFPMETSNFDEMQTKRLPRDSCVRARFACHGMYM